MFLQHQSIAPAKPKHCSASIKACFRGTQAMLSGNCVMKSITAQYKHNSTE